MARNALGSLVVKLGLDAAEFTSGLTKQEYAARQHAEKLKKEFATVGTVFKTLTLGLGVPLAAAELLRFVGDLKSKAAESDRSIAQLNATLQATGNAAGLTAGQLEELGQSIQKSTVFDDDGIRAAETALLRFRSVQGDTFKEAIRLAPDVATALGTDLTSAAQALGRALTDPEHGMKALKAAGLVLSEQQKDMAARFIEAGDKASAQRIVLDELAKSVGGVSGADNAGLYGATKRLERAWDDLQKTVGRKLSGDSSSTLEALTGLLSRIEEKAKGAKTGIVDLLTSFNPFSDAGKERREMAYGAFSGYTTPPAPSRTAVGKINYDAVEQQKAQAAAVATQQKEADDQAYIRQQAELKRRADNAATIYAAQLIDQKGFLDREQAQLEFAYSRGTVTTANYYANELSIAERTYRAEIENIDKRTRLIAAAAERPSASQDERLAGYLQIEALVNQKNQLTEALSLKRIKLTQDEIVQVEALRDKYTQLNQALAESSGDRTGAALIGFDLANRDLTRQFEAMRASGDDTDFARGTAGLQAIATLRERTRATGELATQTAAFGRIQETVNIAGQRIDLLQQTGAITEIDALNKRSALAREYIGVLQRQLEVTERAAKAAPEGPIREDALLRVEQMRLAIEQLGAQTDLLADKFNDVFKSAFTDALTDFATGAKSIKDIIKDLEKSIVQSISRIAAQNISESLFGKEGALGGVGGFFSKLFGGGGGAASTASGAAALTGAGTTLTTAGSLLTTAASSLQAAATSLGFSGGGGGMGGLSDLFGGGSGGGFDWFNGSAVDFFGAGGGFYAKGGNPPIGRPSIVGEEGPEWFVPKVAGTIVPNDAGRGMYGGDKTIIVNMPQGTSRASANQVAAEVARKQSTATRRNF